MIEIKIDASEVNKVIADLSDRHILHEPMEASLALLHDFMARYPAQRPTRYKRTGHLGRRWTTRIGTSGDGITGILGNSVAYGPFVQDERRQSRVHQGYWQTDADAIRQHEPQIQRYFDQALQRVVER